MDDFADRFRLLCESRGFTCSTIAAALVVDMSAPSRWMRGIVKPRNIADVVERLFGMSLGEFFSVDLDEVRAELAKNEGADISRPEAA
jgi:transcriptional regulator with XRE-family HTH domain